MINTTSIRFTIYDVNDVACMTQIVPLVDLPSIMQEMRLNLRFGDWLKIQNGIFCFDEIQVIEDSVVVDSFEFLEEYRDMPIEFFHFDSDIDRGNLCDYFDSNEIPYHFWSVLDSDKEFENKFDGEVSENA